MRWVGHTHAWVIPWWSLKAIQLGCSVVILLHIFELYQIWCDYDVLILQSVYHLSTLFMLSIFSGVFWLAITMFILNFLWFYRLDCLRMVYRSIIMFFGLTNVFHTSFWGNHLLWELLLLRIRLQRTLPLVHRHELILLMQVILANYTTLGITVPNWRIFSDLQFAFAGWQTLICHPHLIFCIPSRYIALIWLELFLNEFPITHV